MAGRRIIFGQVAWPVIGGLVILAALSLASVSGYLLFHSIAEIFAIVISAAAFTLAWNSRHFSEQHYLLFAGTALLAASALNILHVLSYNGMGVFPVRDADLPTQLWLARRYLESIALLVALLFLRRRLDPTLLVLSFAAITVALLASIFLGVFPVAYVDGVGLTPFKVYSEYLIAAFFLAAAAWLFRERKQFEPDTATKLIWALVLSAAAEILFTFYVGVYDLPNRLGHFVTIVAYYLIYLAVVESGVIRPYTLLSAANEELRVSRRELRALAHRLVQVQEDQSRALSREIHDTSAQGLSALKLNLLRLQRKADSPEAVLATVEELNRIADTVVEDMHRLSLNLRPSSLDRYGLQPAVEQLVAGMRRQTGIEVNFGTSGMEERLPDDVETAFYRIVQEATTNITRYAQATQASIAIERGPHMVRVTICDNGIGFDVAEALGRGRLGLLGMRERAQMLGGTFAISSSPGRGATIEVEAPLDGAGPAPELSDQQSQRTTAL